MATGIIKVMKHGNIVQRFWLKRGFDRGKQPDGGYKWDFDAMDEKERRLDIQVELDKLPSQE